MYLSCSRALSLEKEVLVNYWMSCRQISTNPLRLRITMYLAPGFAEPE